MVVAAAEREVGEGATALGSSYAGQRPCPPAPQRWAGSCSPAVGEDFAFAVGDVEILGCNPFIVHDPKHGMGLIFGSSLLEIALAIVFE